MSYTLENFWRGRYETKDTMLELLEECRVFSATSKEGRLILVEECDECFSVELTKDQALALAEEIKQLAENIPPF